MENIMEFIDIMYYIHLHIYCHHQDENIEGNWAGFFLDDFSYICHKECCSVYF